MIAFQTTTEPTETEVIAEVSEAIAANDARQWLWALGILAVAIVLSRVARMVLTRVVERTGSNSFLSDFLGRLLGYAVVAIGLVYALEQVGVEITPLLGALGLVGIALAFALQSILENFVAGVLLQIRRPFAKGDEIESQDYTGVVISVDSRTMTVLTPSGETVRLPNAEVIQHPIVNLTEHGRRRTTLDVGVAYGTDLSSAISIARSAIDGLDGVLATPAPSVVSTGFGDSSLDLSVLFWHGSSIAEKRQATDQVMRAIDKAFADHGISIPFPQRTLHLAPRVESALADVVETPAAES